MLWVTTITTMPHLKGCSEEKVVVGVGAVSDAAAKVAWEIASRPDLAITMICVVVCRLLL
jgi:hypothetical protein